LVINLTHSLACLHSKVCHYTLVSLLTCSFWTCLLSLLIPLFRSLLNQTKSIKRNMIYSSNHQIQNDKDKHNMKRNLGITQQTWIQYGIPQQTNFNMNYPNKPISIWTFDLWFYFFLKKKFNEIANKKSKKIKFINKMNLYIILNMHTRWIKPYMVRFWCKE